MASIPLLSHIKILKKFLFTADLLDVQHFMEWCEDQARKFPCCVPGKALSKGNASTIEWLDRYHGHSILNYTVHSQYC